MIDTFISKEQFLVEHNKLSPANLQATFSQLTQFQEQKKPLLKDAHWSFRLRIPFISWLLMLPLLNLETKKSSSKLSKKFYENYPETKN